MSPHEYVILEIARERERQVKAEGWTAEHDDTHADGAMARAAACYAYFAGAKSDAAREVDGMEKQSHFVVIRRAWPWSWDWWKPKDRRRDLIRAAALIVAEIERLDRARAALSPASPRCEHCDGTGDVHRADGEWLGVCSCPAGDAMRSPAQKGEA